MANIDVIDTEKLANGIAELLKDTAKTWKVNQFRWLDIRTYGSVIIIDGGIQDGALISASAMIDADTGEFTPYMKDDPLPMVKALHNFGCPQNEIAKFLDISQSRVSLLLAKGKKNG